MEMTHVGVKASGYGRELAAFGAREFTNVQTVWIGPAATAVGPSPAPRGASAVE